MRLVYVLNMSSSLNKDIIIIIIIYNIQIFELRLLSIQIVELRLLNIQIVEVPILNIQIC